MSNFAIRDDDTSALTQPEELEEVYSSYWGRVPVSLAIIPYVIPGLCGRPLPLDSQPHGPIPLEENSQLVNWLRQRVASGHIEVMLHGFTHEYRNISGGRVGEYGWKTDARLVKETFSGKQYLEKLLNCRIRVFVPPSNTINSEGIRAIRAAGLNLSGIMGRWGDRPLSLNYLLAWQKRWLYRIRQGRPYPWPLRYDGHAELVAHALTPSVSAEVYLKRVQAACDRGFPFVLATHYWEFRSHPSMHNILRSAIDLALQARLRPSRVSEVFFSIE